MKEKSMILSEKNPHPVAAEVHQDMAFKKGLCYSHFLNHHPWHKNGVKWS